MDGLNEIAIGWPMPEFETGKALEKARLDLLERIYSPLCSTRSLGEIHFVHGGGWTPSPNTPLQPCT
jgi:hypothetical protein